MKTIRLSDDEIKLLKGILCKPMYMTKQVEKIIKKFVGKSIKTSSAKAKGRNLQKWVCQRLADLIGIKYDQSDDNCEIHSREMGQKNVDVILRGKVAEMLPFSFECKNSETFGMKVTLEQVQSNQKEGTDWVIVYKSNGMKQPVVVVDWGVFEAFLLFVISDYRKKHE
jgi:hypothetical protein